MSDIEDQGSFASLIPTEREERLAGLSLVAWRKPSDSGWTFGTAGEHVPSWSEPLFTFSAIREAQKLAAEIVQESAPSQGEGLSPAFRAAIRLQSLLEA